MAESCTDSPVFQTRILHVNTTNLGQFEDRNTLQTWQLPTNSENLQPLQEAAGHLRRSIIPVGFPTETVYGLGADATRSNAVKGIYKAKGRPSDNPLIVHICDLTMLRNLIQPFGQVNGNKTLADPIPAIYKPLIERFWPGPLTILLPNPSPSKLAPEVTAGLPSFGVRMPESPLALSLIHLTGVPLAAPSANASTKPSPTTAEHVLHDLNGKIEIILDGGPCQVGVESTVVDGLCDPPVILRPGGVSIDLIRQCEGWSGVVKEYKDHSEVSAATPRAPGMKYKHYSPKAKVVLYEAISKVALGLEGSRPLGIPHALRELVKAKEGKRSYLKLQSITWPVNIGVVRTKHWQNWAGFSDAEWWQNGHDIKTSVANPKTVKTASSFSMHEGDLCLCTLGHELPQSDIRTQSIGKIIEIALGKETKDIAHGLFSALRELDLRGVDIIYVEGIDDEGDIAAAVMNRLRKAAYVFALNG